jgi:hypothetical protein
VGIVLVFTQWATISLLRIGFIFTATLCFSDSVREVVADKRMAVMEIKDGRIQGSWKCIMFIVHFGGCQERGESCRWARGGK